jgi:branched-chain amino acid transport system permease protein
MLTIRKAPIAAGACMIIVFPLLASWVPALGHYPDVMIFAGIYCLITIGLSLLMGYAGQISLGHAAFYGIGAYASGILTTRYGLHPFTGMLAGALAAAAIALAVGAPSLKLRGHYLAMATLAFGIIVNIIFREEMGWTGGPDGLVGIPDFDIFGWPVDTSYKYYYLVWSFVAIAFVFSINLIQSPVGRALRAIHASEPASAAMGIHIAHYKITIFIFSAVLASLAGSLYAHYMNFVNPSAFDLLFSIKLIIMISLGGIHRIWGAVIGAVLIAFLSLEWLHFFEQYEIAVYGAVLLLVTVFLPEGLAGLPSTLTQRMRR